MLNWSILFSLAHFLADHLLACPAKKYLHIECPGCGFQRSFIALIRGDIVESLKLYPPLIPILGLVLYSILHLKFKFHHGPRNIKIFQAISASIILLSYLNKIIHHQIFV